MQKVIIALCPLIYFWHLFSFVDQYNLPRGSTLLEFEALINTTFSAVLHLFFFFFFLFYLQLPLLSCDHKACNEKNPILVTAGRFSACWSCNKGSHKVESESAHVL